MHFKRARALHAQTRGGGGGTVVKFHASARQIIPFPGARAKLSTALTYCRTRRRVFGRSYRFVRSRQIALGGFTDVSARETKTTPSASIDNTYIHIRIITCVCVCVYT